MLRGIQHSPAKIILPFAATDDKLKYPSVGVHFGEDRPSFRMTFSFPGEAEESSLMKVALF
jgi:hypothetical protein